MEIINVSDEVWMWEHQKYGMSQIMQKLYSVKKNWYYLAVTDDGRFNWRKINVSD